MHYTLVFKTLGSLIGSCKSAQPEQGEEECSITGTEPLVLQLFKLKLGGKHTRSYLAPTKATANIHADVRGEELDPKCVEVGFTEP